MKLKKLASLALAGALTLGLLPALSMTALAAEPETSTYTLTIPSALTVSGSGWNATTGISATGTLANGKKLTVTASSANSFKLKSGNNEVGYTLTTAEGGSQTTSWEFTELSSTATKKDMGIIVEDYSEKPAGTYTDTVTFTAKVENAAPTVGTVFPIGTADLGDYYYWNHEIDADRLAKKFRNFGNATISISSNYSHSTLGNYRVIRIDSSTAQYIDWEQTQIDPNGPWATWSNNFSANYFKVDNYDTTPTGIRIASGSGTEDDPFSFEIVFD